MGTTSLQPYIYLNEYGQIMGWHLSSRSPATVVQYMTCTVRLGIRTMSSSFWTVRRRNLLTKNTGVRILPTPGQCFLT